MTIDEAADDRAQFIGVGIARVDERNTRGGAVM
jgi:hypothetical protein